MKTVRYTNVFISGIFFSGPPSQILQAWKNKKLRILLSQDILDEYHRVAESLSSKYPTIDISRKKYIRLKVYPKRAANRFHLSFRIKDFLDMASLCI